MRVKIFAPACLLALGVCFRPDTALPSDRYRLALERAESLHKSGDFDASIRYFKKALDLSETSRDKITVLSSLGLLSWNTGGIDESNAYYLRAHTLAEGEKLAAETARLRDILGITKAYQEGKEARRAGKLEESISRLSRAVQLSRAVGSREHEVKCLRQLSASFYESNQKSMYFRLNAEALRLAVRTRLRREEGYCLYNLGIYHQATGNYSTALDCFSRSYGLAVELDDPADQSSSLMNLGAVYIELGNFDGALEKLDAALEIDLELGDASQVAQDLNNLGIVHRKRGYAGGGAADYERALEYYGRALQYARSSGNKKDELKITNNIGSVLTDQDRNLEALEYFKKALAESEKNRFLDLSVICLNNLGIINTKLGNMATAIGYYQRSIDLALEHNRAYLWETYLEIGNNHRLRKDYEAALKNYRTAISIIEDIRSKIDLEEYRATYLGTDKRLEAYLNLIDVLVTLDRARPGRRYDEEAFHFLERAKARAFLDSLEVSHVDINSGIELGLVNREKEILADISRLHGRLLDAEPAPAAKKDLDAQLLKKEEEYDALKREIRRASPSYAALKFPETVSVPDARKLLPDDRTAFFSYCLGKERSYGFCLTRKKLLVFPMPSGPRLQAKISAYLGELTDPARPATFLGRELFDTLVSPGLDPETTSLIIVPDDILSYLPFETLLLSNRPSDRLILRCAVSYAPSVSSLRELVSRKKKYGAASRGRIFLMGDPDYGGPEEASGLPPAQPSGYFNGSEFRLPRLKFSGLEIDRIASLTAGQYPAVFKGREATETRLKNSDLNSYRVIHLSAHGLIDDRNPARSAIVLAREGGDGEDGFLQMREVFNLRMRAGLVVLSACDTGLGPFIRGEGLQGLNRAFFYAGADAVLMSLWAVNDEASAQLMERFYHHLQRGGSPAQSLRLAKSEMLGSAALAHPYYWAGFVVTGRADKVLFPRTAVYWVLAVVAAAVLPLVFFLYFKFWRRRPKRA